MRYPAETTGDALRADDWGCERARLTPGASAEVWPPDTVTITAHRHGNRLPPQTELTRRLEAVIDSLLYLSLGEGRHVNEIRFSLMTAARTRSADDQWQVVLYTDRPDLFAGLPAQLHAVDDETAAAWSRAGEYVYRGKICALDAELRRPGVDRAAIIDGDTYFKRDVSSVFDRVRPGRTVMHLREGRPGPPEERALRRVLEGGQLADLSGQPWGITRREILWNSGVVGMHREDARLLPEVLHLNDELLRRGFAEESHIAEMLAFSVVLDRRTRIKDCYDIVMHYWFWDLREAFHRHLSRAWSGADTDPEAACALLWPERPKPKLVPRVKFAIKRAAARVGVEL